jgi:putative phosphoribosyl transferase
MKAPFLHRAQAGETLAGSLAHFAGRQDITVLALPPGGVPVAFEVARALGVALDLAVVQPILQTMGPPSREVTLGLLGFPAAVQLHEATLNALALADEVLGQAIHRARQHLRQRVRAMRPSAPTPSVKGRTVILVDDGTAAGVALRRAAGLIRRAGARALVAAVPVGAGEGLRLLASELDEVICPSRPEPFIAVPNCYERYPDVTDAEVHALLAQAWGRYVPRELSAPSSMAGPSRPGR